MLRIHALPFVLLLISSSAQSSEATKQVEDISPSMMYLSISDNYPKTGEETQVFMGDRMLRQGEGKYLDCLTPNFRAEAKKIGGWTVFIKSGVPICKGNRSAKKYYPTYHNGIGRDSQTHKYAVILKEKKGKYSICLREWGINVLCEKNLSENDFVLGPAFVSHSNSFQRVIEYNGKRGSVVRFIYSEFEHGSIRAPFTRDFEADLNESKVIAYKGAVIEILEANNATINYRVVRHFQE